MPDNSNTAVLEAPRESSFGSFERSSSHLSFDRERLFADLKPLINRLIHQYGDDAESRKDLSGEIYYRFCTILDAYDPTRGVPLRPYLIRQLKASVYSYSREGWRRRKREVGERPEEMISLSVGVHDPAREWDHDIVFQDTLRLLPDLIAKLPKRQRQVVVWRYYEGRSFEQIAETLGVQPATARSLLRHGLNNLRRIANLD